MVRSTIIMILLLLALLMASCSGSRMVSTQMDADRKGKPIKNVLIIGVIEDKAIRENYEKYFMERLNAAGVEAMSSAQVLPVSIGKKLDKKEIIDLVEQHGIDTVAVTHLVDREQDETFSRSNRLSTIYNQGYYRYYTGVWDNLYEPTVYSDHVQYFLETRLYDVKTQKLIWTGESETMDPKTIGQAIGQIVSLVMDELKKNGLLPAS